MRKEKKINSSQEKKNYRSVRQVLLLFAVRPARRILPHLPRRRQEQQDPPLRALPRDAGDDARHRVDDLHDPARVPASRDHVVARSAGLRHVRVHDLPDARALLHRLRPRVRVFLFLFMMIRKLRKPVTHRPLLLFYLFFFSLVFLHEGKKKKEKRT